MLILLLSSFSIAPSHTNTTTLLMSPSTHFTALSMPLSPAPSGSLLTVTLLVNRGSANLQFSNGKAVEGASSVNAIGDYEVTAVAVVGQDGAVGKTVQVPLCATEQIWNAAIKVADAEDITVTITVTLVDSDVCVTVTNKHQITLDFSTTNIFAVKISSSQFPDASASGNKRLTFYSDPPTNVSYLLDLQRSPIYPSFKGSNFLPEGDCFVQCDDSNVPDSTNSVQCLFLPLDVVPLSSIFFAVSHSYGHGARVKFQVNVSTAEECVATASEHAAKGDTYHRQLYEGWLFGAPAVVFGILCIAAFVRHERIEPTEQQKTRLAAKKVAASKVASRKQSRNSTTDSGDEEATSKMLGRK
eukprot:c5320_g1_i2.p1 GENE.c5320_g1_i2~~c5320_g1_i2.p1  ORF type:complete len:357 (-),score=101.81 c5320_g1_i2:160-1230(-)